MLKLYTLMFFSFMGFTSFSQTQSSQKESLLARENEFPLELAKAEQELSLEGQGFKAIKVDEKIIYRKEINGIIVEFTPKKL